MTKPYYLWDQDGIRLQLVQSSAGAAYNWLCFPGGPGGDSSYLQSLGSNLKVPGNVWLIDLPGNGSNQNKEQNHNYRFDGWFDLIVPLVEKFANPIFVGHAFGATLALQLPPLERLLKGLVIISSSPTPHYIEQTLKNFNDSEIKCLNAAITQFHKNPCDETYHKALLEFVPFYFSKSHIKAGEDFLGQNQANYTAPIWWHHHIKDWQDSVRWIPKIPTLIIAGSEDRMTPLSLFSDDKRFQQKNIICSEIIGASHFPWIEDLKSVQRNFDDLLALIEA